MRSPLFLAASTVALAVLGACGEPRDAGAEGQETGPLVSEGATEPADGSGEASDGAEEAEAEAGAESSRLDVAGAGDEGGECSDYGVCERVEFSYVWVANTDGGTVSKIDTRTVTEVGRYRTGPDPEGHPSRTAVTFDGRAVAVANRWTGGVVKVWASEVDCVDKNGNGVIDTSTGAADVRAWGEDECVAWFAPTDFTTQRPVAWAAGSFDTVTCTWVDQVVWTAGCGGGLRGAGGGGPVHIIKLDGDDGSELLHIEVPEFSCEKQGPYGAALDGNGDVWISARTPNVLARVRGDSGEVQLWDAPEGVMPYGMNIDRKGRVWVTNASSVIDTPGVSRFDPATETWASAPETFSSSGGVVQGPDGRIYALQYAIWENAMHPTIFERAIVVYDPETLTRVDEYVFDGAPTLKGVSFDGDGLLWVTSYDDLYQVNPAGWSIGVYRGLSSPYTYSDMTGNALFNVNCPPAG